MIEWIIDQPFNPNRAGGINCMSREQGYVDLAVLSGEQADAEWQNSDRETIMDMKHLHLESICIDDIWQPTDQLVIVRGVAGIGKSTMIQRYVLKWAKDEILTGAANDGRIDFLFFFECRELNTMPNIKSFEESLKEKYPQLCPHIDLSDLQNIASRIMIIVDGLDELQGIYDEDVQKGTFPTTELVKRMIDTKSSILKGHKTIVGGRPNACEFIKSKMMQTQKIKTIDVCGFNESKSIEYIERFFQADVKRAEKVKEIIKRPNIRMMSSVPVFLWVICLLYSEDFKEEINSVTELYTYGLFTFLKNHLRGYKSLERRGLCALVSTKEFGEMVYSLSKLSVKTYMNNQVVFTDDDIKDFQCPIHLEQTGFIVKHCVGKFGIETYQFKHLVFQEFLCALYLCLAKGVSKYNTNRELSSCTPTILGIHHLVREKNNQLFLVFYQNLKMVHKSSRTLTETIKAPYKQLTYKMFVEQHLNSTSRMIKKNLQITSYGGARFKINSYDFKWVELIRNFRENDWLVDEKHLKKIRESEIEVTVYQQHSLEVLEFLRSLQIVRINQLYLAVERFRKVDLDFIEMTDISSTMKIYFEKNPLITFSSNSHFTQLYIPFEKKLTVPNAIKESVETYVVYATDATDATKFRQQIDIDIAFDNVFHLLADLIEHVLENHANKKLVINYIMNNDLYGRLVQKIQSEFGQREHFEKIVIEEINE